jgi:DNA-binding NarL/FixJ family response regulator
MSHALYIIEDHEIMRTSLRLFLDREDDLAVMGTAATAEAALDDLRDAEVLPDLILVDVSLPSMSGIDLVRALRDVHPKARCLMVSGHAEQVYVTNALEAGAAGYAMKGNPDRILKAVRAVLAGEEFLSKEARRVVGRKPGE